MVLVHFSKLLVALRFVFYSPPTSHPLFQPGLERLFFFWRCSSGKFFTDPLFSIFTATSVFQADTLKLSGQLLAKPSKGPLFVFLSPCMVHPLDSCHRSPSTVYSTYQAVVLPQAFQGFPCQQERKVRCPYQGLQGLTCCP